MDLEKDIEIRREKTSKKNYESAEKEIKANYIKSKNILKGHFKALYENVGMEWTEKNSKEIDFVIKSIERMAVFNSGELLLMTEKEKKLE